MRTLRAAAALAAALVLAPAGASALPLGAPRYDAAATTRLYSLVDAHRRAAGLPGLTRDARLERIARGWTWTMATTGRLAHNDALFTKATHTLLGIKVFGENVGYASRGVDSAHQMLLDSPHHRDNIESRTYAVSGFAVVVDAKGVTWVTEDFGTRPAATASPVRAPATAPRTATPPPAAPAPVRTAQRRPSAPRATAPAAPRAARRAAAARPVATWVAPAFPVREDPTDRVAPASDTPAPAAAHAVGATARRSTSTPLVPAAAVLAGLALAAGVAVSVRARRSATLEG